MRDDKYPPVYRHALIHKGG